MAEGLLAEVEALRQSGYSWQLPAMSGLGYRQFEPYFNNEIPLEDAVAAMDLYRTVRRKWEKAVTYKINKTNEILLSNQEREQQQLDSSTDEST